MTLGPDILLDAQTHDLKFVDGDLVMVEHLPQAVKIHLMTFLGEWFLDRSLGLPFLTEIFIKGPNLDLIRSIIRREVQKVEGIDEVVAIVLDFDTPTRRLDVTWTATVDGEELEGTVQAVI